MTILEKVFHKYVDEGANSARGYLYALLTQPKRLGYDLYCECLDALDDGLTYIEAQKHHHTLKKDIERKYNYEIKD